MSRIDKEAWTIAGTIFIGSAIALAIAMAVGFAADKVFSGHLWPRIVTAGLILLVPGFLFFRNRGERKQAETNPSARKP
jgi:Na+/H+ antiporter NhaC